MTQIDRKSGRVGVSLPDHIAIKPLAEFPDRSEIFSKLTRQIHVVSLSLGIEN